MSNAWILREVMLYIDKKSSLSIDHHYAFCEGCMPGSCKPRPLCLVRARGSGEGSAPSCLLADFGARQRLILLLYLVVSTQPWNNDIPKKKLHIVYSKNECNSKNVAVYSFTLLLVAMLLIF